MEYFHNQKTVGMFITPHLNVFAHLLIHFKELAKLNFCN